MPKTLILFLLGFLALAYAQNISPEKTFFFLPYYNGLRPHLFQTMNGIIAYSFEDNQAGQYAPYYVQIDMGTNNVTHILEDLPTACGQGLSAVDRLHYHALTYSLVYYCTNNNSILLIDPIAYDVKTVVPLNISETFQEVRITTDGYSVVFLGLSGLFTPNPNPSHLIKYSLQTHQVVNHVVFDHNLTSGEAVTAYGSNGNSMFIMTNIVNSSINIANVYGMTLIGNSYSLTHLSTFNSTNYDTNTLPELFIINNLIITNNEENLVVLDQDGNLQGLPGFVVLHQFQISSDTFIYRPVIVSDYGSSDVYALLDNSTVRKLSVQKQGYNVWDQGTASSIFLVNRDQNTDTLLFSFSGEYDNFRITDLDRSETVYESVTNFTDIMITDKTYCVISRLDYVLYIFGSLTDDLLQVVPINLGYYDQESSTYSYLILDIDENKYKFNQIDLQTGRIYNPFSFDAIALAEMELVHATNSENFDAPQLVLHIASSSDEFLIVSQTFGQVKLSLESPGLSYTSTLAVDYDTLTAYYFLTMDQLSPINVTEYHYNSSKNSFFPANSNQYTLNGNMIPATDYSVIATPGKVAVIDMSSLNQTEYSFPNLWDSFSTFQNSPNGFSMVLSQQWTQQWGAIGSLPQPAGILSGNHIQDLLGITNDTEQAGTAGNCSYWIANQVGSFVNVHFYDICDNGDKIFDIIA